MWRALRMELIARSFVSVLAAYSLVPEIGGRYQCEDTASGSEVDGEFPFPQTSGRSTALRSLFAPLKNTWGSQVSKTRCAEWGLPEANIYAYTLGGIQVSDRSNLQPWAEFPHPQFVFSCPLAATWQCSDLDSPKRKAITLKVFSNVADHIRLT